MPPRGLKRNVSSSGSASFGRTGIAILDAVLDHEPVPPPTWPPPAPAPAEVAPLLGTWWWMGREHTARWGVDGELVIASPGEEWRFTPEGPDRWRGQTGEQAGEILTVLRDPDGAVAALDIGTFVFRREPLAD